MAFTYQIIPPGDVIERSFSAEPDDINVVSIKIEMSGTKPRDQKLDHLLFKTVKPPAGAARKKILTTNPNSITPVAQDFGNWTIVHLGNGEFKATPIGSAVKLTRFILHDVEVTDESGTAELAVTEVWQVAPKTTHKLPIRLIEPHLRIDYFVTTENAVTSKRKTTLSWATTGATVIQLKGPGGESLFTNTTDPGRRDDSIDVKPATTSTYTLIAGRGDSGDFESVAYQQVTVTVTDQAVVNNLKVDAKVLGNLAVETSVSAPSLTATATATAKNLVVKETATAKKFAGDGVVPKGGIIMWSGTTAPAGWVLCDGRLIGGKRIPDLRGRFVAGYDRRNVDYNAVGKSGGEPSHTLTEAEMPTHNHTHDVTRAGKKQIHDILLTNDTPKEDEDLFPDGGLQKRGTRKRPNLAAWATIEPAGSGHAHENRPPYWVLAYIMKL